MTLERKRRIAAQRIANNQHIIDLGVVELTNGYVSDCYPLMEELAHTEWIKGTINIRKSSNGKDYAYYKDQRLM